MKKYMQWIVCICFLTSVFSGGCSYKFSRPLSDKEIQAMKKADRKKMEKCRQSIKCWGERHLPNAQLLYYEIEKYARYSVRWTNASTEPKFSIYRWIDDEIGIITYLGDKLELQNGFRVWVNYIYECDYDPRINKFIDIRLRQGRL